MNRSNFFFSKWIARGGARLPILLFLLAIVSLSACTAIPFLSTSSAANQTIPNTGPQPTSTVEIPASGGSSTLATMPAAVNGSRGPKAYIGLFKDNAVAVLDTATNHILKTIPIPTGPHGLVISADGRWVYASSDGDSKVSVIDTITDSVVKTIEVGKSPHGLALTPDGHLLLAAVFGASQVVFIDPSSDQVVGQVPVPSPHNIAISPDGHTAYVAAQKQGSAGLSVINIQQKTQTAFLPFGKAPRALNFSPDGKLLYFTQAGVNAVQVLDPSTNRVTGQIDVGASPHQPLFVPDESMALVVSQGPGEVDFLAPQTSVAFLSLKVGTMPHWIAVNPQGTTAWVTNEGSNSVSVIDLKTFTVTATIPVGNAPRKIVVQPGKRTAQASPENQTATVAIQGMAFSPATLTVKANETVTWINQDSINHTVTADQGGWDSGPLAPQQSYQQTFSKPGEYAYHCSIHPFMTGKIVVTQ